MLDDRKAVLYFQVTSFLVLFERNYYFDFFENFGKIYLMEALYLRHIIYTNQADSYMRDIPQLGNDLFDDLENLIEAAKTTKENLNTPKDYESYPVKNVDKISGTLLNFSKRLSRFSMGLETVIDNMFYGTKRSSPSEEYILEHSLPKISNFELRIYKGQRFPSKQDIDRLHELRSWGNLAVHDIFPAISKDELDRNKNIIHRLLKKLVKLEPALF